MANKNAKPPDNGFKDHPERINRKGQPRKLPRLDEIIAEVLGAKTGGVTAVQQILAALRTKAKRGDVRAAEALLNRGYGLPKQKIDMNHSGGFTVVMEDSPNCEPLPDDDEPS